MTRLINILLIALVLVTAPVIVLAQPAVTPTPPGVTQQQTTADQDTPTVYGLQGVLIETVNGKMVAEQAANELFNPASAIKLGTALVALQTLGPNHRFTTAFWTNGFFNKATGEVNGNLYVTGRDPSFHYEHGVMVARQLNSLGIRTVTGNLIVAPGFTMNFSGSARRSGELLYDTLDATLRSGEATRAWIYERTTLGDRGSLQAVPSVSVMGEIEIGPAAPGARILLSHKSSKLTSVLKVLLCYSNNFMAERIGDGLGGTESVRRQLITKLRIPPEQIHLASLSGLGVNRVTPRVMMKILRALRVELQRYRLTPADVMPVAGIDPGTLEDRFTGPAWQGSVIAKTGTLIRTDGGASSLVGQMRAAKGEVLLFVIFNQRGSVLRFRQNQDYLVMQVQNSRGGPRSFRYRPLTLSMRLADTQSISGTAGNEFEPQVNTHGSTP
jgi:D-alanyl-D-alanine carboxypeptidase/D-alanyl-D-alanine-endopeptidase (penicillin-binding protein 4)